MRAISFCPDSGHVESCTQDDVVCGFDADPDPKIKGKDIIYHLIAVTDSYRRIRKSQYLRITSIRETAVGVDRTNVNNSGYLQYRRKFYT